jgi:hypothetical protein
MPLTNPIDLDKLDAALLKEIEQQVAAGIITQAEADRLKAMIAGSGK